MKHEMIALGLCALAGTTGSVRADVVTDWHSLYQEVTRLTGGAPCPISRSGPMLALAMYDAINGIDLVETLSNAYTPYQQGLASPAAGSSREAAAAAAAHRVMSALHGAGASPPNSTLQALLDDQLASDLAGINGKALLNGITYGVAVADSLLALRANDGYDADPTYIAGDHPGDWRPTPDGPFGVDPFSPHWGNCTPWGLETPNQFRPTRFLDMFKMDMDALMHSAEYAEQINGGPGIFGVKDYGDRDSLVRTADQTEIAWFWANDRDGTSKPPGQLIDITRVVSDAHGLSLSQNARLYGLVGIALGDACIAAWDAKYNTPIDLWRPIDAIRETQDDGNASTTPVTNWLPLNDFTPPFPAYVSGHATFGATHAAIMASFFGTDDIAFEIGSDEFAVNPGLGYDANLTRSFDSFSEAAWENALSRVFLGVHYQWDAEDAYSLGTDVGNYIFANHLRPIESTCPADLASDGEDGGDGVVDLFDLLELLANWGTNGGGAELALPSDVVDLFDLLELLAAWGSC